jgi:hypothetical protein
MCRFERRDLVAFLIAFLPFGLAAILGMIAGGYVWGVPVWCGYWALFFFGLEGRVLCSHCPYWAELGPILHCHANYGVIKLWRYRPGPMAPWERAAFLAGVGVFVGFPLVLLVLGGQYALFVVALVGAVSAGHALWRHACGRCVNLSCPANHVPKAIADGYLRRNPAMRRAWEEAGYRLNGDAAQGDGV